MTAIDLHSTLVRRALWAGVFAISLGLTGCPSAPDATAPGEEDVVTSDPNAPASTTKGDEASPEIEVLTEAEKRAQEVAESRAKAKELLSKTDGREDPGGLWQMVVIERQFVFQPAIFEFEPFWTPESSETAEAGDETPSGGTDANEPVEDGQANEEQVDEESATAESGGANSDSETEEAGTSEKSESEKSEPEEADPADNNDPLEKTGVATLIATGAEKQAGFGWKLEGSKAVGRLLTLDMLNTSGEPIQIVVTFRDGQLHGTADLGNGGISLVRFVPTSESTIAADVAALPMPTLEGYDKASAGVEDVPAILEAVTNQMTEPIALEIWPQLFRVAMEQTEGDEAIDQVANGWMASAMAWGPVSVQRAAIPIAEGILYSNRLGPQSVMQVLNLAEFGSVQPLPEELAKRVELMRAVCLTFSDQPPDSSELIAEWTDKNPFDLLLFRLRDAIAGRTEDVRDDAELAAEVAVLPPRSVLPANPERALKLYRESNNLSEEGFQDFLKAAYETAVGRLGRPAREPAEVEGTRQVALLEVFTGGTCAPCVAADLATVGLEKTFADELIAVRYHQHIPGPDPIATGVGQGRFQAYALQGTPSLLLNGAKMPQVGGPIDAAAYLYDVLVPAVESVTGRSTPISIDGAAQVSDGAIRVAVTAAGLPADKPSLRLRMVLAQESLWLPAPNGIKEHGMLVRDMPGGLEGIARVEGADSIEASETIDVAVLRKSLIAEATRFLQQGQVAAPSLLNPVVGLSDLRLVAFIQDDANGEILQVAVLPVEGQVEEADLAALTSKPKPELVMPAVPDFGSFEGLGGTGDGEEAKEGDEPEAGSGAAVSE